MPAGFGRHSDIGMSRTVSISTALFDGYPVELAIDEIAAAGARSIEPAYIKGYLDFDEGAFSPESARCLSSRIAAAGLHATAVSAHMNLGLRDALGMLVRRIRFAAALGASFLITNTGQAKDRDEIVDLLRRAAPECHATGVRLALENPGHGREDLIGNARDGASLIDELALAEIGLNYDVGNVFTYSGEAIAPQVDLSGCTDRIVHLHLKDVASRDRDWIFTPIGDGSIDYRAVWSRLPGDLPVGIELPLRLDRRGRSDPKRREERVSLDDIRRAMSRSLGFVAGLDAQT